ncbi:hypothetical protein [Halorubellus litoreus]|uniref:Uncharacterized protein n=1 Tax=Halorubellus litoreus TaxID=755308 RepID=A0ABD5VHA9_9EURY
MASDTGRLADKYSLGTTEKQILFSVTGWFNAYSVDIQGRTHHIGRDPEPTLRELCSSIELWSPQSERAHQAMIEAGLFKSPKRDEKVYIAGRRCKWLPTEDCLTVIENLFKNHDDVYPPWATTEHSRPPTFRDGPELMSHRKGVMVAGESLKRLNDVTHNDYYPQGNLPQRPDLRIYGPDPEPIARVEVLTNHGNTGTWENKFTAWQSTDAGPTIWLFENRRGMVRFWNHLVRHGFIQLDNGMFGGEAQNWSSTRVNDRLERSRDGHHAYSSVDLCWTMPGMLAADRIDLHEWAKALNIK